MEQNPISSTLMRMVYLRAAEPRQSGTLSTVRSRTTYSADHFDNYVPLDMGSLKAVSPNIGAFAEQVLKNKSDIAFTDFMERKEAVSPLSDDQLEIVWNEFLYQSKFEIDQSVKRMAMNMLLGNHFVSNINGNTTAEEFRKLLDARIVLPKVLFEKTPVTSLVSEKTIGLRTQEAFEEMKAVLEVVASKPMKENLLKGLIPIGKEYDKRVANERALYESKRNSDIAAIAEKAGKTTFQSEDEKLNYFASLRYPAYDFSPSSGLLASVISEKGTEEFKVFWGENDFGALKEAKLFLEEQLAKTEEILFHAQNAKRGTQKIGPVGGGSGGGSGSGDLPELDEMTFRICPLKSNTGYQFPLVMVLPNREVVQSIGYQIFQNNVQIASSTYGQVIQNPNGSTGVVLFSPTAYNGPISTNGLSIKIRIQTTNANTYLIDTAISLDACVLGKLDKPVVPGDTPLVRYGVKNIGIADYRKVEQTVCCYVAGEVSHIENLMAREMREKIVKNLRREETQTTTETSTEQERMTDSSSTEKHEMNKEISKLQREAMDMSVNLGVNYGMKDGPWSLSLGSSFAYSNSKEESERLAITESKELTERAMDRVVTKSREEIIKKVVEEFSEQKTNVFDNRQSPNHISGVFRWVDKIYKNEIHNYGKRMMLEFAIPEPGRFHRIAKGLDTVSGAVSSLRPPLAPSNLNPRITNASDISRTNYMTIAGLYNADVDAPPVSIITNGKSYTGQGRNGDSSYGWNDLKVPVGYKLTRIDGDYRWMETSNGNDNAELNIAGLSFDVRNRPNFIFPDTTANPITPAPAAISGDIVPIGITTWDTASFVLNIIVEFSIEDTLFQNWQTKTYSRIMEAYSAMLSEFEEAVRKAKEEDANMKTTNPLYYRDIEKTVLRKNCTEYLLGPELGRDNYQDGTAIHDHKVKLDTPIGEMFDAYASKVKFIEQAFEWDIMSYQFYAFYWAHRGVWERLYAFESEDKLFTKFLQSGMARVIVTVRPGFEKAVKLFMATGKVWNGGDAPMVDDEMYLDLAAELMNPEYKLAGSWETRVPSSLTILQNGVIGLDAQGLPCDSGCQKLHGGAFGQLPNEVLGRESFPAPVK